jgi:uncharacterized Rossmann fold enzyme
MPMYYFHLEDDETIVDSDGTDLVNIAAAREHAAAVAHAHGEQYWLTRPAVVGMDHECP